MMNFHHDLQQLLSRMTSTVDRQWFEDPHVLKTILIASIGGSMVCIALAFARIQVHDQKSEQRKSFIWPVVVIILCAGLITTVIIGISRASANATAKESAGSVELNQLIHAAVLGGKQPEWDEVLIVDVPQGVRVQDLFGATPRETVNLDLLDEPSRTELFRDGGEQPTRTAQVLLSWAQALEKGEYPNLIVVSDDGSRHQKEAVITKDGSLNLVDPLK